jgi:adenylate cyclase
LAWSAGPLALGARATGEAMLGGEAVSRRLAAIVVAYSRLTEVDEEGTLAQLKSLRHDLIDPRTALHKVRTVKTVGDGLLVEFASAVEAAPVAAA